MNRRQILFSLLAPLVVLAGQQPVQDAAATPTPKPQFFAGVVVEVDAEHLKVSRTLLGRPPETHVFALDGKTKTPKGGIKVKNRVTVRYEHWPERDLALEIQVRSGSHTQKTI